MQSGYVMLLFCLVAFLYASVGHGGASGYLAIFILAGVPAENIRTTALTLNLIVASIAFLLYFKAGHFRKKLFIPLASASIPLAWLGAQIQLPFPLFKVLLAGFLLFSIIRLLNASSIEPVSHTRVLKLPWALIIGAVIGFISGLIGIGGGILLSPILLMGRWSSVKEAAAIAAPFILVNSASALFAMGALGSSYPEAFGYWTIAALIGGFSGAFLGSGRLPSRTLRFLLATVLLLATGKLLMN